MGQTESKTEKKRAKLLAKRRTVRVLTACIMGKRRSQEDRHVALEELPDHPEISVFAIYDGHNGDSCAEFCKNSLHANVSEKIKKGYISPPLLKQAFVETDDLFLTSADREAQEAGCTAVVAIYNRVTGQLITGNAGDARCLVSHKGKAQMMTIDHKPDVPDERKRIEAAGRKVIDSRLDGCLAVSRALGDLSLKREIDSSTGKKRTNPDQFALSPVPFVTEAVIGKEHDFIVLACDGLFDVMSNQEVVDWISARLKMEKDDADDQAAAAAAAAAAPPNPGPMSAQSVPAPKGAQVDDDTVVTRPASWSTDSATAHALTDEQLGTSTAGPGDTEDAPVHHRPAARGFTDFDDDDGPEEEDDGLDPRQKFEKEKKKMEAKHRKRKEQQRLRMRMQTLSNRPNQYVEEEDDEDEEDKKPVPKKKSSVINTNNMALDLAEYAVKRGSMDNISIIIVALGPKRSSSQSRLQVSSPAPGSDSTPGSPRSKNSENDPASAPA